MNAANFTHCCSLKSGLLVGLMQTHVIRSLAEHEQLPNTSLTLPASHHQPHIISLTPHHPSHHSTPHTHPPHTHHRSSHTTRSGNWAVGGGGQQSEAGRAREGESRGEGGGGQGRRSQIINAHLQAFSLRGIQLLVLCPLSLAPTLPQLL